MRITQLMIARGFGGAERSYLDTTIGLAELGHEVQAICHPKFHNRALLSAQSRLRIDTVCVRGWWDVLAAQRVRSHIRDFAPDVVHAHLARGAYIAGKAAQPLGIPLTVKLHNYANLKYYRAVDHFICTTPDQRRYLAEHGIAGDRIDVIPNFSTVPPVHAPAARHGEETVFVACGRLVPVKAYDQLLRAMRLVLDRGRQARLILGGDGPLHGELATLRSSLDLDGVVEMTGWVSDAASLIDRGDVFVVSSHSESFGIVLLEAMARGKAIVTTRCRGPLQVVDETMAHFAKPSCPESLADALEQATMSEPDRLAKAETAVATYRQTYQRGQVLPRIVEVYEKLAAGRRANAAA